MLVCVPMHCNNNTNSIGYENRVLKLIQKRLMGKHTTLSADIAKKKTVDCLLKRSLHQNLDITHYELFITNLLCFLKFETAWSFNYCESPTVHVVVLYLCTMFDPLQYLMVCEMFSPPPFLGGASIALFPSSLVIHLFLSLPMEIFAAVCVLLVLCTITLRSMDPIQRRDFGFCRGQLNPKTHSNWIAIQDKVASCMQSLCKPGILVEIICIFSRSTVYLQRWYFLRLRAHLDYVTQPYDIRHMTF